MSKSWYLLGDTCGSEEVLSGEAVEWFSDALDQSVGIDVELCNFDLSICKKIKAVIQGTVQDTKLKTLTRTMLTNIGTCKAGMYVKYNGRYWLIVGIVDDNGVYEKAVLSICNYLLSWVNSKGEIVQRWVNITSASQYNSGETSTYNYSIRSDQLMVLTPDDDECLLLDSGVRFIIDRRCSVYEKNLSVGEFERANFPLAVYKLTRADSVLYNYGDSGFFEFLAHQEEQQDSDGCYFIDGKIYWLCQNPTHLDEPTLLISNIEFDSNEIYNSLEPGEFTARFYDEYGNISNIVPQWNIYCDFSDKLDISYFENTILIYVDDPNLVNRSFDLELQADGYDPKRIQVDIKAFL